MSKDYDEDNDLFRTEQIEKFYAESKPLRRELTDEEILEVWKENYGDVNIANFARAILKKASDK